MLDYLVLQECHYNITNEFMKIDWIFITTDRIHISLANQIIKFKLLINNSFSIRLFMNASGQSPDN